MMADSGRALREFGRACALKAPICSYATGPYIEEPAIKLPVTAGAYPITCNSRDIYSNFEKGEFEYYTD